MAFVWKYGRSISQRTLTTIWLFKEILHKTRLCKPVFSKAFWNGEIMWPELRMKVHHMSCLTMSCLRYPVICQPQGMSSKTVVDLTRLPCYSSTKTRSLPWWTRKSKRRKKSPRKSQAITSNSTMPNHQPILSSRICNSQSSWTPLPLELLQLQVATFQNSLWQ